MAKHIYYLNCYFKVKYHQHNLQKNPLFICCKEEKKQREKLTKTRILFLLPVL
jgi:hypothetical protein